MRAELIPMAGGKPIPITRDITVVGRREYCDIQVEHASLSKRHCVLVKTDGLLIIRDLATTNGTKVKGQLVRWAALLPDDRLTLGKVRFRVYLGPEGTTSAEPGRSPERGSARPPGPAIAKPPVPVAPRREGALVPALEDNLDWLDGLKGLNLSDEVIELD